MHLSIPYRLLNCTLSEIIVATFLFYPYSIEFIYSRKKISYIWLEDLSFKIILHILFLSYKFLEIRWSKTEIRIFRRKFSPNILLN